MSRTERFALFAGIIGFVADILTLGVFVTSWIEGTKEVQVQVPAPPSVRTIVAFTFIYSWLAVCWFLVRRSYLLFSERNRTVQWISWQSHRFAHSKAFSQYVIGAVFAVAILLSPFVFLLLKFWFPRPNVDNLGLIMETVFFEGMIGLAICTVMVFAMPVVYADIETDLFTIWVCLILFPLGTDDSKVRQTD